MNHTHHRHAIWIGLLGLLAILASIYVYLTRPPSPASNAAPVIETQEITTEEGFRLLVAPYDSSMGHSLIQHKTWHPAVLKLLSVILPSHDQVLHLGANTGFLEIYMAQFLKKEDGWTAGTVKGKKVPMTRILALEDDPSLVSLLNMNIQKHGLGDVVQVYPIAAGQKESQLTFCSEEVDPKLQLSSPLCQTVRTVPLDSLTILAPSLFITSGLEGSEVDAILGARSLLARGYFSTSLLIEWNPPLLKAKGATVDAFIQFLKKSSYRVYTITGDRQTVYLTPTSFSDLTKDAQKRDLLIISRHSRLTYNNGIIWK